MCSWGGAPWCFGEDVDRKCFLPRRLPENDHGPPVGTYLQAWIAFLIPAFTRRVKVGKEGRRGRDRPARSGIPQPESLFQSFVPRIGETRRTQGLLRDVT